MTMVALALPSERYTNSTRQSRPIPVRTSPAVPEHPTIRMTLTAYVQEVKSSQGTFAGILKQKEGDDIEIWDLSKMPPLLRKLKSNQVESMKQNEKWKHPPATAGYTPQELADIIGFLKWASTGSQKEVAIADLGVIE